MTAEHFEHISSRIPIDNQPYTIRFIINKDINKCPICKTWLYRIMDITVDGGFKMLLCENKQHFYCQSWRNDTMLYQTIELTTWPSDNDIINKFELK